MICFTLFLGAGCVPYHQKLARHLVQVQAENARQKQALGLAGVPQVVYQPVACPAPDVSHYNGYFCCDSVKTLSAPTSQAEAVQMTRAALLAPGRIRGLGHLHTGNDALCTDGTVIRTDRLKRIVGIETFDGQPTVVAEAGVTVYELNDWLHARGFTLGMGTLEFRDATVAGAIATGAHGSSPRESSVLASRVVSLYLIAPRDVERLGERYTAPIEYSRRNVDEQTFRAMRAGMGLFGLVTQVRLRIDPEFNLDVRVSYGADGDLWNGGGVAALVEGCDWGQIVWFPRSGDYVKMCGTRTTRSASRDAENTLLDPDFTRVELDIFQNLLRDLDASNGINCTTELLRYTMFLFAPPQKRRCLFGAHSSEHVVGPAYKMASSRLTPFQAEIKQNDFEVAVPLARAREALLDVKHRAFRDHLCMPLTGVFLRFSRADAATLIGHATADDAEFPPGAGVMFVELVAHRPDGAIATPTDPYFAPYWAATLALIEDHHGRAHWAKNQRDLFVTQRQVDPAFAVRVDQFRALVSPFDPTHRFADDFTDAVGLSAP
jgi:FAD/FMN-containing dehydrogenase